jgi:16S rRNA processing protein RimM
LISWKNEVSELPGTKTVTIGKIAGAHGVRGDFPSRFEEMDRLELYSPEGWHKMSLDIVSMRFQEGKGVYLAKASGIVDRDDAEAMKGLSIKIPAQERVTLPEDSFWVDDILGLSVEDEESGEILGVICEIFPTGGNDVYVVKTPEGSQKMLPAIREVVRLVDLERGVILVRLLDGLWD